MNSKRSKADFDYAGRAAAAEAARFGVKDAFAKIVDRRDPRDPGRGAWKAEVLRFHAAIEAAYPPGFWEDCAKLRRDDWSGLESALRFLEADPFFFRSGYVKARLLRLVKRAPLGPAEADRLRRVVISAIDGRDRREFRCFCRLAIRIDAPGFRGDVAARAASAHEGVRRRARWVMDALCAHGEAQGPPNATGAIKAR